MSVSPAKVGNYPAWRNPRKKDIIMEQTFLYGKQPDYITHDNV